MAGPTVTLKDRLCPKCGCLNIRYSPNTQLFECISCKETGYNFPKIDSINDAFDQEKQRRDTEEHQSRWASVGVRLKKNNKSEWEEMYEREQLRKGWGGRVFPEGNRSASVHVKAPTSRIELEEAERNEMTAQAFDTWKKMEIESTIFPAQTDSRWAGLGTGKRTSFLTQVCPKCKRTNFQRAHFDSNYDYYRCADCGHTEKMEREKKIETSSAYQKAPMPQMHSWWSRRWYDVRHRIIKEGPEKIKCPKCKKDMYARYKIGNHTNKPDWYECPDPTCGYREFLHKRLLREHRVTILSWAPRLLVILIGIFLFSIELVTFGGGAYAGSYIYFAIGGGLLGLFAWYLGLKDAQKKQRLKEAEETANNASEGAKSQEPAQSTPKEETETDPPQEVSEASAHASFGGGDE